MLVRAATRGDADALAAVHRAAAVARYADIFPVEVPPPSVDDLAAEWTELIATAAIALVVLDGREVVGGVVVGLDAEVPAGWRLHRLYVHPDRWRSGVGSRLHDDAVTAASELGVRSIDLWVLEQNAGARSFYERRGWSLVPGRILRNEPPEVIDVMYELDIERR